MHREHNSTYTVRSFILLLLFLLANPAWSRDISFSWTANTDGVDGYKLYYDTDASGAPYNGSGATEGASPVTVSGQQTTFFTLHGLSDSATYYFTLTAYLGSEESGYAGEVVVGPETGGGGTVSGHFSWLPNSDATLAGYKIHYGTQSRVYTGVIDVGNPALGDDDRVHGYVPELVEGTTYYFACTAYDTQGAESSYSNEIVWTATSAVGGSPPVANNLSISTNENTPASGTVSASNTTGLPITYAVQQNPGHGALLLTTGTGAFSYTPATGYYGSDSFTFVAHDDNGDSSPATVTITITAVNSAPQAQAQSITVSEDTPYIGQLTATDPDSDPLTYSRVSQASRGSVTVAGSGSFTYVPADNQNGSDSFTFKVNDGTVDSSAATVSITITPVNDTPVVSNGSVSTTRNHAVSGQLQASDIDNDPLTYAIVNSPGQGSAVITNAQNGSFTYTPNTNVTGTDSFTFKVNDGAVDSSSGTITVTIAQSNVAPVATGTSFSMNENSVHSGQLTGSDGDGDPLTYSVVTQPAKGAVSLSGSGAFTYTPNQDTSGSDSFTFKVNDGYVNSAAATVSITIIDLGRTYTLNWTAAPEPVDGYKVYYKTGTEPGSAYDGTGLNEGDSPIDAGKVTSFLLSGLQNDSRYSFAITAYHGGEESGHIKESVIWTGDLLPPSIEAIIQTP